jgi:hypothetical protein
LIHGEAEAPARIDEGEGFSYGHVAEGAHIRRFQFARAHAEAHGVANCVTQLQEIFAGNTGCGVTRSFTYQVNDQNAQPIQAAGLQVWDAIVTTSPNNLNLTSYGIIQNISYNCDHINVNGR